VPTLSEAMGGELLGTRGPPFSRRHATGGGAQHMPTGGRQAGGRSPPRGQGTCGRRMCVCPHAPSGAIMCAMADVQRDDSHLLAPPKGTLGSPLSAKHAHVRIQPRLGGQPAPLAGRLTATEAEVRLGSPSIQANTYFGVEGGNVRTLDHGADLRNELCPRSPL
jgi:hypothetical protein